MSERTIIVSCWGYGCGTPVQGEWQADGSQIWYDAGTDQPHTCPR